MKMQRIHRQRGLSIATALFVITVMALLAVVIFRMVRSNAETTQEEILLVRAFYAAESGVQFGLNAVFPVDPMETSSCPAMPVTYTMEEEGLDVCTAEVTCTSITPTGGEAFYTVKSKGTCGGVSRTVQVRAQ